MKAVVASIALFVAAAFAQSFTINTPPSVVECEPTLISWSGGMAPYYLSILPGATPQGTPLETFPATNATSYTWQCNIQSGTSIGLTLRDSTGQLAQSASVTVQAGSSSSCLTSPPGTASSASATAASTDGVTATGTSSGATTGTGTTGSASPSASSTTSSSGASANLAQFGTAGIVGAAVAALFL